MNRKQLYVELETTKNQIKRGNITLGEGAERMLYFVDQYKTAKLIDSADDEEYNDVLDSTISIYHRIFLDLAALTR